MQAGAIGRNTLQINERKKAGPRTPEGKARAVANLKKWKPGQSGNPAGRPKSGGLSIKERVNELLAKPDLTLPALQALIEDKTAHPLDIAAATWIVGLCDSDRLAFDRLTGLIDYTDGRPKASIEVRAVDNRTPHEQLTELLGQVRSMGIAVPDAVKVIE